MSELRNFHNTTATFQLYLHQHCRTKGIFSITRVRHYVRMTIMQVNNTDHQS